MYEYLLLYDTAILLVLYGMIGMIGMIGMMMACVYVHLHVYVPVLYDPSINTRHPVQHDGTNWYDGTGTYWYIQYTYTCMNMYI